MKNIKRTSIVSIIRNRNNMCQQTIQSWLQFDIPEFVIVDFRDDSCESIWDIIAPLQDPRIKVIETKYEYRFIISIAMNLACSQATYPFILKLDIDYLLHDDFFDKNIIRNNEFISGDQIDPNRHGALYVSKTDFDKVNGYNENLIYHGGDDQDIYERLARQQLIWKFFVNDTFTHMYHTRLQGIKNQYQYIPDKLLQLKNSDDFITKLNKESLDLNRRIYTRLPWSHDMPRTQWQLTPIEPNRFLALRTFYDK